MPSERLQELVLELDRLIRSRYPIIMLETAEEQRALSLVREVARLPRQRRKPERQLFLWSIAGGLRALEADGAVRKVDAYEAASPAEVLRAIETMDRRDRPTLVVLADFVPHLVPFGQEEPGLVRQLRELAFQIKVDPGKPTVVITGVLWPEIATLADEVKVVTLPLPDEAEIGAFLDGHLEELGTRQEIDQPRLTDGDRDLLVGALLGLPLTAIDNLIARAAVTHLRVGPEAVPLFLREKRDLLRRSGSLTYVDPEPPEHFAGYPALRRWLQRVARANTAEARRFGIRPSKGGLLVGLPGCGKDLLKRVSAAELNRPLLELDFGLVMGARGGVVGQAAVEIRQALAIARAMRCVLGLAEFEKAVGGLQSSNASDGGETARAISTLLNWMAEQEGEVFVFATANDIRGLAPEQVRAGRFGKVWWVDLPSPSARADIFAVHLRRVGRAPEAFDLPELAHVADQFSGAEIETAVQDALALAFEAGRADVGMADLVAAVRGIRPLAVVRGDDIRALREWAARLQLPNAETEQTVDEPAAAGGRALEL
jgi:hypothetical protein